MSELPDTELSVGVYPFSKKICLVLRRGGSCRILARFDSRECADLFLALQPAYRGGAADLYLQPAYRGGPANRDEDLCHRCGRDPVRCDCAEDSNEP